MYALSLLVMVGTNEPTDTLATKMLPIYSKEASEYTFAVETAPKKELELKKEPIFEWSNPVRQGLQQGVVFLWVRDGRPAAFGSIFSQPEEKPAGRRIIHEFHALVRRELARLRTECLGRLRHRSTSEGKYDTDCIAAMRARPAASAPRLLTR